MLKHVVAPVLIVTSTRVQGVVERQSKGVVVTKAARIVELTNESDCDVAMTGTTVAESR